MNDSHVVSEEQYIFKPATRSKLFMLLGAGILLFAIGVYMAMSGGNEEHGATEHAAAISKNLVASTETVVAEGSEGTEHHGSPPWLKRVYTTLWMNNVFFIGFGLIGLFFIAIQYAAQAGWSAPIKRIPLAIGHWIPFAGIMMLVLWFVEIGRAHV